MFKEHSNVIWGAYCNCGNECSILQNLHHPWVDKEFSVQMKCASCGSNIVIDQISAQNFYNSKIYSFFTGITGTILDFGCGDGFLSRFILSQQDIQAIYGIDIDTECIKQTKNITDNRFEFMKYDGCSLNTLFPKNSIDYLVSRDVFMFIDNPDQYFLDINQIIVKGVRQMGWYKKTDSKIKNRLEPQIIARKYESMGWHVQLKELDWYKSGYFISANRI